MSSSGTHAPAASYGPFLGWTAQSVAVGPDGAAVYIAYPIASNYPGHTEIRAFDIATGKPKAKFPAREGRFGWKHHTQTDRNG